MRYCMVTARRHPCKRHRLVAMAHDLFLYFFFLFHSSYLYSSFIICFLYFFFFIIILFVAFFSHNMFVWWRARVAQTTTTTTRSYDGLHFWKCDRWLVCYVCVCVLEPRLNCSRERQEKQKPHYSITLRCCCCCVYLFQHLLIVRWCGANENDVYWKCQ